MTNYNVFDIEHKGVFYSLKSLESSVVSYRNNTEVRKLYASCIYAWPITIGSINCKTGRESLG